MASNGAGKPAQSQVETAEGGMWPLWCHSHQRARVLWCTTCTTAVCGGCRGGDHKGHQVSCEDDRGGAATRWPIPGEWRGWWGNRTNLLKETVEEEGKGAAVRFAGAGLKEVRKRFADLSKQLHPDKVVDEEKKVAATAKWVAAKAAYDLLRELALARPGGGGRRSASEDRRGI